MAKIDNKTSPKSRPVSRLTVRLAVHAHLKKVGFSKNGKGYVISGKLTKEKIRSLHSANRTDSLKKNQIFMQKYGHKLIENFAVGNEINPEAIDPELIEVASAPEGRLFRFASQLWSVPVSQGFGRRLRFLVKDRQNGKIIGIFALGDPVFNLSCRDNWIGWTGEDRKKRLIHMMDAYVVGSVPPYSQMIGGKLVAALMGSREVKLAYERKYLAREGIISERKKRARLVLLTTVSALGRSSLYNRLVVPNGLRFIKIGETRGFGHFHFSGEMFELMRNYLKGLDHPYASAYEFGMGPNWRIRVVRAALEEAGFDGDVFLNHGIKREVYAIPLVRNYKEVLLGQHKKTYSVCLPASEISQYCLQRWVIPRAARDPIFKDFERDSLLESLLNTSNV